DVREPGIADRRLVVAIRNRAEAVVDIVAHLAAAQAAHVDRLPPAVTPTEGLKFVPGVPACAAQAVEDAVGQVDQAGHRARRSRRRSARGDGAGSAACWRAL